MTITIHRQSRMQRIAVSLLVSAVAVVAAIQISGTVTEDSGSPAHVADPAPASNPWIRLQQVQDAYLPPAVATPSTAGQRAFLEVQDDFLPPETPQPAEGNAIRLGLSVPQ